jgi:FkbM family methyltransferase
MNSMELKQRRGTILRSWTRLPEWPRILIIAACGIALGTGFLKLATDVMPLFAAFTGETVCPVERIWSAGRDNERRSRLESGFLENAKVIEFDSRYDIERIGTPERQFWVKRSGRAADGRELIAHLMAEHSWMAENNPWNTVRPGDVVSDCGGHVGVFTHRALKAGARTVVTVEPEPTNLECLRRNFQAEISAGRVAVVPKGVWSFDGNLRLSISTINSGMNSVVRDEGGQHIEIPVTTIDSLVGNLGLKRVDYIKMDIEGAEREALAGAQLTLTAFRPRLMLDTYHRPDDPQVLPALLRKAHAGYSMTCGPCEVQEGRLVPHVTYFE